MALGLQTESGGGGDFNKVIKFDARAGRMFRVDREQDASGSWNTENVEVTNGFTAIMDLENIEVGWCLFAAGVAPQLSLVKLGHPLPQRPSDQHKQGFRMMMKLGKSSGGDVREIAATSKAVLGAVDDLHNAFEAGRAANPNKLPVVALTGSKAIVSTGKGQTSTNYAPIFEITKWVDRPADLGGAAGAGEAVEEAKPAPAPVAASSADDQEF